MGTLYYVIGASGVGKDSVMEYARKKINGSKPVLFAHRYITRAADAGGENHIALTKEEFGARLDKGLFLFHWNSHNQFYGIGIEINQWLEKGFNVVVNGSRGYLSKAQQIKKDLKVVIITAKPETIKNRLIKRGRESREEIEKRITRNDELQLKHNKYIEISNDMEIEQAGEAFINLIVFNK